MTQIDLAADRRQFLAALAAMVAMPSASLAASPTARHAAIRAMVERYVAEKRVANMVVAVGGRHGPPDYASAGHFQLDEGPLAGPDTLYGLNSMTKPIVGFAVMALIEDGKLGLDTPLADIFPAFAQLQVLTDTENSLATKPATRPMKVRHIVTHSAGLAYDFNTTGKLQELYRADALGNWMRVQPGERTGPKTLADYADAVATLPLMFEPGTSWRYSIGLDLAAAVVEKVSGMPFQHFIAQRLFEPLGMRDTFYTVPADKLDRLAAAYRRTDKGIELVDTAKTSYYRLPIVMATGGGGLVSSAHDYARFMAMLLGEGRLNGVRVMKTQTARLMMSDLLEPGTAATTSYGTSGHGAGGRLTTAATPIGEGVGTYGWGGSSNTLTWVDRVNGAYIVIMTQIRQWYPNPIYDDFIGAHYADLAAARGKTAAT
jgi:CubicO group peptidase (beta-lactamase class C family)